MFYYRLSARVEAHELSEVVARDGHNLLVLGLEELDKLRGRTFNRGKGMLSNDQRTGGSAPKRVRGKKNSDPGRSAEGQKP